MVNKSSTHHKAKAAPAGSSIGGLGGLLDGIGRLLETASKLKDAGAVNQTGEFAIPGLGEKGKGVFGFSIRTLAPGGAGGEPAVRVQPFGNIRKDAQGLAVEEAREPVVDVFEEADCIRVVAEVPGVSADAIHHDIRGDILRIWTADVVTKNGKRKAAPADNAARRYNAEVLLPAAVKKGKYDSSYNNGIFELRLPRA